MVKASKETIKQINRQNIINVFFKADTVSKSEVIEQTKLSPATVNNIIQELVDETLLLERHYGESSGGRRPMLYSLNAELYHVLAIKVSTKNVLSAVINLEGTIVASRTLLTTIHNEESLTEAISASISLLKEQDNALMDSINTVAFSIPGIMNYTHATVVYSAALYVENYDLKAVVQKHFKAGLPVRVYKDTDAMLLGEYHCGLSNCENMAFFLCENGVGLSVMNRNKLFWSDSCGMEIGHTVIDIHGKQCKCGLRGCVSTLLGENRAIERYIELNSEKTGQGTFDSSSLDYLTLYAMADEGDSCSKEVIEEQIQLLALTLVNIVNLFNPTEVVLGGPLARIDKIGETLNRIVQEKVLKPFAKNLSVRCSKLNINASLSGMAFDCIRKDFFKSIKF